MYKAGTGKILLHEEEHHRLSDLSLNERDFANFLLGRYELKELLGFVSDKSPLLKDIENRPIDPFRLDEILHATITTKCTGIIPQIALSIEQIDKLLLWALWGMHKEYTGSLDINALARSYEINYPILAQWLREMARLKAFKKQKAKQA